MKRLTLFCSVALVISALCFGATSGRADARISAVATQDETFTHAEAGVQFQLPKGWKAKPDG